MGIKVTVVLMFLLGLLLGAATAYVPQIVSILH